MDIFTKSPKIDIYEIFIGKLVADLGMTGSGKSNTAARIIEQLLEHSIGLTLLDIEGEYWGLQEKYEVLIVGKSERADVNVDEETFEKMAASLAEKVLTENIPLIIDLSGWSDKKWDLGLIEYFTALFQISGKIRRPHGIIIEEAQEFIPQSIGSDLKDILVRVAKRGRKRGLSTLLASQRSPDIDKKLLSQCEVVFCHRVSHPTDLDVYYKLIPLERKEIKEHSIGFADGQCYLKLRTGTSIVQIKKRETFHGGDTPRLGEQQAVPQLKKITKDLVKAFESMAKSKRKEKDLLAKKETEIKRLGNLITVYEKEILSLEQQLQIASRIKVELPKSIEKLIVKRFLTSGPIQNTNVPIDLNATVVQNTNGFELHDAIKRKIRSIKRSLELEKERKFIVMNFLEENHPDKFNTSRLSSRLGFSNQQLYAANPKLMIDMGMIKKSTASPHEESIWESNLKNFVREKFIHFENEEYQPLDAVFLIFQNWIAEKAKIGLL